MILRLLSDVFTVTCLFSVAVAFGLTRIGRRKSEWGNVPLWLALFFASLGLFVLFDNALPDYFLPSEKDLSRFIAAVVFSCALMQITGSQIFSGLFRLNRSWRIPLLISYGISGALFLLSLLTFRWGAFWYIRYLGIPIEAAFMGLSLLQLLYFSLVLFRRKLYREPVVLLISVSFALVSLYISINRIFQELDKQRYMTNHYLPLTLLVPLFILILYRMNRTGQNRTARGTGTTLPEDWSDKDRRITEGLIAGRLYKEIAFDLEMSEGNVKKHVNRIYTRLGVSGRLALIRHFEGHR